MFCKYEGLACYRERLWISVVLAASFFVFSISKTVLGKTRNLVESVQKIEIYSIKQKCLSNGRFLLEGEVEVFLDDRMHICADSIEIDRTKNMIFAIAFRDYAGRN